MRIRIITFHLAIARDEYVGLALEKAPEFSRWPGLLAKWWIGDDESGTYGGVYVFASREDADRSRDTDLFRSIFTHPALQQVNEREYDLLDAPTSVTVPNSLIGR